MSTFTSEEIEQRIGYMLETPRRELPAYKVLEGRSSHELVDDHYVLICLRHAFGQTKREGLVALRHKHIRKDTKVDEPWEMG